MTDFLSSASYANLKSRRNKKEEQELTTQQTSLDEGILANLLVKNPSKEDIINFNCSKNHFVSFNVGCSCKWTSRQLGCGPGCNG